MKFTIILISSFCAHASVYLHSPRGSNNRLNENSAQNKNNERIFKSNNNRRGGYNVGEKSQDKFEDESGQYAMKYFQSGLQGNSYLTIEWTNLLGCGYDEDGDKIHNCEIVVQTNCQSDDFDGVPPADSYTIRNGKVTNKMPYELDPEDIYDPEGRCFIDGHDRDMKHRKQNIPTNAEDSIQYCLNKCESSGYIYAGIQFTKECWCDNDFGKYGEAPLHECYRNCKDGSGNKCGGKWRQNVYLSSSSSPEPRVAMKNLNESNESNDDYNQEISEADDDYEAIHLASMIESYDDEVIIDDDDNEGYDETDIISDYDDDIDDNNGVSASGDDDKDDGEHVSAQNSDPLVQPGISDGFVQNNVTEGCRDGGFQTLFSKFLNIAKSKNNVRRTAALGSRSEKNDRRSPSENRNIGLHESWEYYDRCEFTFGKRHGMECMREREQWPDDKISPWVDVAYFSDETVSACTGEIETLNHRQFFECVEFYDVDKQFRKHKSIYHNESECVSNGGEWLGFYKVGDIRNDINSQSDCLQLGTETKQYVWGRPMSWKDLAEDVLSAETCIALPPKTQCLEVPNTRSNYLGDIDGGRNTPRFEWILPQYEEDKRCVLRIRYIISTDEEEITPENHVVYNHDNIGLSLAVTPTTNVFEDRSHVFKLLQRDDAIGDELNIHNLVVRGKRGNIVQTYPAVEYDFVPNRLTIPEGDAIHVQWTGSNSHNNAKPAGDGQSGAAGEGRGGTDRNNFIQLINRKANLVAPDHNHTLFKDAEWVWSSHQMGASENKAFNLALSMATSGYYHCEDEAECERAFDNTLNRKLDNASPSYFGNIFVPSTGEYHYKCMRNDNFSNRAQKGTIIVA